MVWEHKGRERRGRSRCLPFSLGTCPFRLKSVLSPAAPSRGWFPTTHNPGQGLPKETTGSCRSEAAGQILGTMESGNHACPPVLKGREGPQSHSLWEWRRSPETAAIPRLIQWGRRASQALKGKRRRPWEKRELQVNPGAGHGEGPERLARQQSPLPFQPGPGASGAPSSRPSPRSENYPRRGHREREREVAAIGSPHPSHGSSSASAEARGVGRARGGGPRPRGLRRLARSPPAPPPPPSARDLASASRAPARLGSSSGSARPPGGPRPAPAYLLLPCPAPPSLPPS